MLASTRIELMSWSWPGSIDVGSATSPTTSVPGVVAIPEGRDHNPARDSPSTIATAVKRCLIVIPPPSSRYLERRTLVRYASSRGTAGPFGRRSLTVEYLLLLRMVEAIIDF